MNQDGKIARVVKSAPPKKLSEWFISNEAVDLESINVWCFNQDTAVEVLIQNQIWNATESEVKPIKF